MKHAQVGRRDAIVALASPSTLPSLPPRYEPRDFIAAGGMASVIACQDSVLRRLVAVKLLAEHLAQDSRMVQRFQREARTQASLSSHPNVTTIYDVGEHDGRPYLVMEHLPGGSIAQAVERGPVERELALRWLRQAADALDFAHQHDIVHRDIKPANLLLDDRGNVQVADFGIARLLEDETITAADEVLGTAAYISPEQAMGEPATPASDRYALAVIAYELLTGRRPFEADNLAAQARAQIEDPPPPPSGLSPSVPPAADAVLLRALSKDPARRWSSAREFVDALESALRSSPARTGTTQAMPAAAPGYRTPVRGRGRMAGGVAIAVAVVGLLVAGIIALAGGGGDDKPAAKSKAPARSKASPTTPSSQPTTAGTSSAAELNRQGYELMRAGRYDAAIPVLQRAVGSFDQNSSDLTYAYALYNLGRSLRLAGRPREAIPVLERRLEIPNQREVVARELAAARADAGLAGGPSAPEQPKAGGKKKDKKKG
jgi:serine/threonine-protein kinase